MPLAAAKVNRGTLRTVLPLLPGALFTVAADRDAGADRGSETWSPSSHCYSVSVSHFLPQSSLAASLAAPFLRSGSNRKATFVDGNFSECEDWRRSTLGEAATRPHRITCRKLTR